MRQLVSKVWYKNWTHWWGGIKLAVGGSAVGIHYLGQLVNQPDVKSAIDALHIDPKIMLGLAVLGAVTILSAEH